MKRTVLLSVFLLGGCANCPTQNAYETDRVEFEAAQKMDTVEAYDSFLVKRPTSLWRLNVIFARDRAAYNVALASRDVAQMEAFLAKYPKSDWAEKARFHVDHGF